MHLYNTHVGVVLVSGQQYYLLTEKWDLIVNRDDLFTHLSGLTRVLEPVPGLATHVEGRVLAPIGTQEVWAAGVTWLRSRDARMEESKSSGASSFYDLVYEAERPELFFKSAAHRVAGPGEAVHIRRDSTWNVPEPELTLFMSSSGRIQGYTIGNDMSSRSIEGENPLYLPQAKTYQYSAALGPCLYVAAEPISPTTAIRMEIIRGEKTVYADSVQINKMKRTHADLARYLFLECDFPAGCYLMTGTCLVPSNDFTLNTGDVVNITIDGIGKLSNTVDIRH